MTIYKITCRVDRYLDYSIEANSKEDAIKQLNSDLVDHYDDYTDYDSSIIHSIKEDS